MNCQELTGRTNFADFLNDIDGVSSRVQQKCDLDNLWQDLPIASTMDQEEYLSRSEDRQSFINDEDARKFINSVTGFDVNFIDLDKKIPVTQINVKSGQCKTSTHASREPFYKKHDDCYVRFNVMNRLFEIVDGQVYICIGRFFEEI